MAGAGSDLIPERNHPRSRFERIALGVTFVLYCAVVITGAIVHEPWWDEAQAWLIARDATVGEFFTHVIRYEGHPPIWYLTLVVPAKLGLPYGWLKAVGVLGGASCAWLILYGFPRVPLPIRLIAPFTFFVAYQYAVVSRSYVLIGPLLLLIARIYDRRAERPGLFALLLILLSNVSVHAFAIACGLGALFLLDILRKRVPPPPKRAFLGAAAAFVLNGVLLVVMLWPPADKPSSYTDLHSPFSPHRHARVVTSLVPDVFWGPAGDESPAESVTLVFLCLIALSVLVFWFVRSGVGAPFAISIAGAYVVALRYLSMWHEGIFFMLILFAAVLAFEHRRAGGRLHLAGQVVLVLLLLRHAQWTFMSLAYDLRHEFTGSAKAARFIAERGLDRGVVYGTGVAVVELQPYFPSNLFDNYHNDGRAYWEWSKRNSWPYSQWTEDSRIEMRRWFASLLEDRPEIIVCGTGFREDDLYLKAMLRNPSYRRIGVFNGSTFWKIQPSWLISYSIFQRIPSAQPRGTPPGSSPRTAAR